MKREKRMANWVALVVMLGAIPAAIAQVAPDKPMAISAYAWPTESSPEPKDDEWSKAQDLGPIFTWDPQSLVVSITCKGSAVREWMRVTCEGAHDKEFDTLLGALWGLAGDLSTIRSSFTTADTLPRYKSAPKDEMERVTRKMGASNTTTFQVKPGTAFLLQLDELFINENYEGQSVAVRSGPHIDVSWALGEKSPTVVVK